MGGRSSSDVVEFYPQWRGHQYFVANDDIVIVDLRDRRSPAVRMHNTGAVQSQSDGSVVNLGPDEIRQVQIALKQKGFYIRNRTECWVREPRRR
jgi:hypothetical protein